MLKLFLLYWFKREAEERWGDINLLFPSLTVGALPGWCPVCARRRSSLRPWCVRTAPHQLSCRPGMHFDKGFPGWLSPPLACVLRWCIDVLPLVQQHPCCLPTAGFWPSRGGPLSDQPVSDGRHLLTRCSGRCWLRSCDRPLWSPPCCLVPGAFPVRSNAQRGFLGVK